MPRVCAGAGVRLMLTTDSDGARAAGAAAHRDAFENGAAPVPPSTGSSVDGANAPFSGCGRCRWTRCERCDPSGRFAPPRDDDGVGACAAMLRAVASHADANWFARPLDARALGWTAAEAAYYRSIIPDPFDLTTIRRRLERGAYGDVHAFAGDVRRVFRNAETFNAAWNPTRFKIPST